MLGLSCAATVAYENAYPFVIDPALQMGGLCSGAVSSTATAFSTHSSWAHTEHSVDTHASASASPEQSSGSGSPSASPVPSAALGALAALVPRLPLPTIYTLADAPILPEWSRPPILPGNAPILPAYTPGIDRPGPASRRTRLCLASVNCTMGGGTTVVAGGDYESSDPDDVHADEIDRRDASPLPWAQFDAMREAERSRVRRARASPSPPGEWVSPRAHRLPPSTHAWRPGHSHAEIDASSSDAYLRRMLWEAEARRA